MKLTPLDIKKQDFSKSLRGYDKEEVDAFLSMLANQWEVLRDEKRRAEERNRDLKHKIEHYENVEEALQEALQTARENKEQVLQNARREAKVIVREANSEAQSIKGDAEERHKQLKREVSQLGDRRDEIVARLRAFLMSEMEILARFDGEDPSGFLKLVPQEGQKQLQEPTASQEKGGDSYSSDQSDPRPAERAAASSEAVSEPADDSRSGESGARTGSEKAPSQPSVHSSQEETASGAGQPPPDESGADTSESVSHLSRHTSDNTVENEEQQDADAAASTEASPGAFEDEESPGWIVHSLFNAESAEDEQEAAPLADAKRPQGEELKPDEEDVTASSEEIEKIRRILSDMDD